MDIESAFLKANQIVHQLIKEYKEELLAGGQFSDITVNQLVYVEAINSLNNPTISEIAEHLKITNASASTAVQKLIKNGLAVKVQSGVDKRVFHIQLTKDSLGLIEAEKKALHVFFSSFIDSLSPKEKDVLLKLFTTFIKQYK